MRAAHRKRSPRGGATGVCFLRRDAPQDAHPGRMRSEGQSGPAAPDRLDEHTTAELRCQDNNIINVRGFEREGMSLVLLRIGLWKSGRENEWIGAAHAPTRRPLRPSLPLRPPSASSVPSAQFPHGVVREVTRVAPAGNCV